MSSKCCTQLIFPHNTVRLLYETKHRFMPCQHTISFRDKFMVRAFSHIYHLGIENPPRESTNHPPSQNPTSSSPPRIQPRTKTSKTSDHTQTPLQSYMHEVSRWPVIKLRTLSTSLPTSRQTPWASPQYTPRAAKDSLFSLLVADGYHGCG